MASTQSPGGQARILIGLSLGKICRGGGGLRRNLLVATVLQKARLVFMEEAKFARQQLISSEKVECRVNVPIEFAVSDKSENRVTEQPKVLCDDLDSRLREEPQSAPQEEVSEKDSNRTTAVKRPCDEKQEVKRVRYGGSNSSNNSPSSCRPHPPRAPHQQAIAV